MEKLPPHIRPFTFAQSLLLIELHHLVDGYSKKDFQSVLIMVTVNYLCMRPYMKGDPRAVPSDLLPPQSMRGSASRKDIVELTGYPKETVRRKLRQLVRDGALSEKTDGTFQIVAMLPDPNAQKVVEMAHDAIQRYSEFVAQFMDRTSRTSDLH